MTYRYIISIFSLYVLAGLPMTNAAEGIMSKEMTAALKAYNPEFSAWNTQDYSKTIQKSALEKKRDPYAIKLDVNRDKKTDLIVDGHDKTHNILLCLVSKAGGYTVVEIRKDTRINPDEFINSSDGKKEPGLHYYLWPNSDKTGFTLAFPQQSDADGNLLSDGAMVDYEYKDGKFIEIVQIL